MSESLNEYDNEHSEHSSAVVALERTNRGKFI